MPTVTLKSRRSGKDLRKALNASAGLNIFGETPDDTIRRLQEERDAARSMLNQFVEARDETKRTRWDNGKLLTAFLRARTSGAPFGDKS